MKVRITKLKAAWPPGAKVGDVVELVAVPAWAVGKCEPAGDDAEVTLQFGTVEGDGSGQALPDLQGIEARIEQANRAAADALALAEDARTQLADAQAALDASRAEADELRKQLADAQAALAKATEPKAKK